MWVWALGGVGVCLVSVSALWAQGRFLLAATSASQLRQNARADADDLSRMRNQDTLRRFL